jgi:hypothetical protein
MLLSTFLHATVYVVHNLLNVLVHTADIMGFYTHTHIYIYIYIYICNINDVLGNDR